MATSGLIGYFGYGSLVNTNTLRTTFLDHLPARLNGWRRSWCVESPGSDGFRSLSIYPDKSCSLDGAIIIDKAENLPLVDEREQGYDRLELKPDQFECQNLPNNLDGLYIYQVRSEIFGETDPFFKIRRSYLDAVAQGYLSVFGQEGLMRFFETTKGWDLPIEDDREKPTYPRWVNLTHQQNSLIIQAGQSLGISL